MIEDPKDRYPIVPPDIPPTIKATPKEDHDKAPLQQVNISDDFHTSDLPPTEDSQEEKLLQNSDSSPSKNADPPSTEIPDDESISLTDDTTVDSCPVDDVHSGEPQGGALLQSE